MYLSNAYFASEQTYNKFIKFLVLPDIEMDNN